MSSLNVTERFRIRSLSIERLRRQALTLAVSSPLLRWRYAGNGADQILIVPQELRAADPSFWSEIAHGHFGLASEIADLKGASPFRAAASEPRLVAQTAWLWLAAAPRGNRG